MPVCPTARFGRVYVLGPTVYSQQLPQDFFKWGDQHHRFSRRLTRVLAQPDPALENRSLYDCFQRSDENRQLGFKVSPDGQVVTVVDAFPNSPAESRNRILMFTGDDVVPMRRLIAYIFSGFMPPPPPGSSKPAGYEPPRSIHQLGSRADQVQRAAVSLARILGRGTVRPRISDADYRTARYLVAETAAAYVSALDPDTVTTIDALPELPRGRADRQQSLFPETDSPTQTASGPPTV
ncbi:MAG: hypothetical protein KC474_04560 [Cyanobacteria bacterium HKST-UBA04]|nr:hypothetical protein [Cyanobacteria bacterium HKST-UBA04]MCA9841461.1 hypothetical protein [Cyanobacteria bacterium HKST-UBA03]